VRVNPVGRIAHAWSLEGGPLAPFANGQYRLFSIAALISGTALSAQALTRVWLVQQQTHSPFMVALVAAATAIPLLLLGFVGGFLSDRFDRRRITLFVEAASSIAAAVLAALVVTGVASTWYLIFFSLLHGSAAALSNSAKQTLLADLVPARQQRGAIGLSMVVGNLAGIAGPAIAGLLITVFSTSHAMVAGAALAFAALPFYALVRADPPRTRAVAGRVFQSLGEGIRFVIKDPSLRWLLLVGAALLITLSSRGAVYPALVQDVLGGGAGALGMLELVGSLGAVFGPLVAIWLASRFPDRRVTIAAGFAFAASVVVLALSQSFYMALAMSAVSSFTGTIFFVTNLTAFQLSAPDEFRGRVVSVRFVSWGLQPAGTLSLGALAEVLGPQVALLCFAVGGGLLFAFLILIARPARPDRVVALRAA